MCTAVLLFCFENCPFRPIALKSLRQLFVILIRRLNSRKLIAPAVEIKKTAHYDHQNYLYSIYLYHIAWLHR